MLNMELPGSRKGRSQRFVDLVKEDMQGVGVTEEEDTRDRMRRRQA